MNTVAVKFGISSAFRFFQLAALSLICSGVLLWLLGFASNAFHIGRNGMRVSSDYPDSDSYPQWLAIGYSYSNVLDETYLCSEFDPHPAELR